MYISSRYTSDDWRRIREGLPDDGRFSDDEAPESWANAIDVMRDRIQTRFMATARMLVGHHSSGFVLLLLDSLLIEYLQRLRKNRLYEGRASRDLVTGILRERHRFVADFYDPTHRERDGHCPCVACDFYRNARSGIAHYAETKNDWRVRYGEARLLQTEGGVRTIDRNLLHGIVEEEFADYYDDCLLPENANLRRTLKVALDGICGLHVP